MRIARKVMAVSELAWDLDNDPRAEPSSVRPSPTGFPGRSSYLPPDDVKVEATPPPLPRPQPPRPVVAAAARVRVNAPTSSVFEGSMTKRITTIDKRLLAIARGEIEPDTKPSPDVVKTKPVPPRFASAAELRAVELQSDPPAKRAPATINVATLDDPFGGLIPVNEDGDAIEVDEAWLEDAEEPAPFSMRK